MTRRSTTGMVALYGLHVLKRSSNVQSTIALLTSESEYYALDKGGSVGLGLESLLEDFAVETQVLIQSDAAAAKGTAHRAGLGKARHIQTRFLWLQERVSMDHLRVEHVSGKANRADALTKSIPGVQMTETMKRCGSVFLDQRSKGQLKLFGS